LHRTVVARLTAERDAAREELEAVEAQMEPLARSMIYKGNSVDYWWAKAHAYKGIVHAVCEAFRALGYGGEMGDLETLSERLETFAASLLGQRRDLEMALDRCKREVDALQQSVGKDTWKHEVCTHDPDTGPSGDFGRVSCEVIDTGYADHLVLLDPGEELIAKRHYDAAQCEAESLRERLADTERLWTEACEVARVHCPCDVGRSHIVQGIPRLAAKVDKWQREAGALRARIDAAYRALEAVGEMVPRGPAGDTLAEKITALVAILRTAYAERDRARAVIAADTKRMLEMKDR
jgi:hypothetical protein